MKNMDGMMVNAIRFFIVLYTVIFLTVSLKAEETEGHLELNIAPLPSGSTNVGKILVQLKNSTDRSIVVVLLFVAEDHYITFDVRDEDGKKVPFAGFEVRPNLSSKDYLAMRPTASYSQEIDLRKIYNLSQGTYKIRATYALTEGRRMEEFIWKGVLKSNEITLIIP
ncbi:MAG: hypothetical protein JKY60_00705 [Kordiimonadaceae bacterium]|nr:hypothetical protein [Kordiimonadaceae bacterium]